MNSNDNSRSKWLLNPSVYTIGASSGTIYVGSDDHKLYAINPDGTQRWSFIADKVVKSSPTVANGTIYVGSDDQNLYAINSDGSRKWSFATGNVLAYSSPAV